MNYRQISTNFWNDEYIYELSDAELKAFVYFFTNDKVNKVGIYRMPFTYATYLLHLNKAEYIEIQKKFEATRKYFFYNEWVFIPNFHKHNRYSSNIHVVNSYVDEFNRIPNDVITYFLKTMNLEYIPPFDLTKINFEILKDNGNSNGNCNGNCKVSGTRVGTRDGLEHIEDVDPNLIPEDL